MNFDVKLAKRSFFDRAAVIRATDRATLRVLSKFGSFVRRSARTLLRRKATKNRPVSAPGEPPLQHTGLLRDFTFFAYDRTARSVVIGPAKLNSRSATDIPRLLEEGGRAARGRRRRLVVYEPRPYMGPALEREEPRLPSLWRNAIKK